MMHDRPFLLALLLAAAVTSVVAQNEAPKPTAPLTQLQWLIGDWHATAKAPDGTITEIDNHIYWSDTHTAILFVTRFNGEPHYSGMYAYDPARKQIGFWYVDSDGQFTQGTAASEGQRLTQKFEIAKLDGSTSSLISIIERRSGDSAYHWQVFRASETSGSPLIELEYTKK